MDRRTKNAEARFVSIMNSLRQDENKNIMELDACVYIKDWLYDESTIRKLFYAKLNDIRYVKNLIKDKTVIDAGCGSGSLSVLLSLLGAKRIYAVDYLSDCVQLTNHIINIADIDNITVIHSDIGNLNLPEDSVDGIFSIEAISHYRNPNAFLDMASRVTKSGGFLVIGDGNNAASAQIKRKTFKIWDLFENHPEPATMFGHSKTDGCYLSMRKEIIKKEFEDLNEDEIEKYARYTFAYPKQRVIEAVHQFVKGDFSLKSEYSYASCPLDPATDCYMEQLFDPRDLKRELRNYGFKSRIKSKGPARREMMIPCYIWELLSPITIFSSRPFQVIATREGR